MNLDFNELEKGVSDGLSKQALMYGVDEGPAVMRYHQPVAPVGAPSRNPKLDRLISKYINKVPFTSGISAAMDDLHRSNPGGVWNENATSRPPLPELPTRPAPFNYFTADAGELLRHNWTPTKEKPPQHASAAPSGFSIPEPLGRYLGTPLPTSSAASAAPTPLPTSSAASAAPTPLPTSSAASVASPTSTVLPSGLQRAKELQKEQDAQQARRDQLFNIGGRSADDTMPGQEFTLLGQTFKIPTSVKDYQQRVKTTLPGPWGEGVAKAVGDAAKIVGKTVSSGLDLGHDIADRGVFRGALHHNFPDAYDGASRMWHTGKGQSASLGEAAGLTQGVAGQLAGLGVAALLVYLMTRDRNRSSRGQGQNININVGGGGGQGHTPAFFNRVGDVNSLSDAKLGSLKEAGVADAVSKAIQTRAINKVLDKAEEEGKTESRPSEKEVEITSKYPEMQKMLEDKQNKAYLERLLKD